MKKSLYIAVFLLLFLCVAVVVAATSLFCLYPKDHRETVSKYARERGIDESLVYAVIKCESGFKIDAVSRKGAVGLMQIMPQTAEWIAKREGIGDIANVLTDPDVNIKIGTLYLKYLLDKYGNDLIETLSAYNAGEGNIDRLKREIIAKNGNINVRLTLEDISYKETYNYVKRVLKSQDIYRKLYNLE